MDYFSFFFFFFMNSCEIIGLVFIVIEVQFYQRIYFSMNFLVKL